MALNFVCLCVTYVYTLRENAIKKICLNTPILTIIKARDLKFDM